MPRQTDLGLDDLTRFYENYYEELGVPKCFIANEIAAEAIEYGSEKAYEYLRNFLKDENSHIRYVGIAALAAAGRSEGIKTLKEYVETENSPTLKLFANEAIEKLKMVN
ncbi:MAG: HEAT repeat domain-containing protein [Patescibacteria group bacterium]